MPYTLILIICVGTLMKLNEKKQQTPKHVRGFNTNRLMISIFVSIPPPSPQHHLLRRSDGNALVVSHPVRWEEYRYATVSPSASGSENPKQLLPVAYWCVVFILASRPRSCRYLIHVSYVEQQQQLLSQITPVCFTKHVIIYNQADGKFMYVSSFHSIKEYGSTGYRYHSRSWSA